MYAAPIMPRFAERLADIVSGTSLVSWNRSRKLFGPRSERSQRLLDQLELQLAEFDRGRGRRCGQGRNHQHPGAKLYAAEDASRLPRSSAARAYRSPSSNLVPTLRRN
jgi:hypothetical protein